MKEEYKIFDKNGIELPGHYSGGDRSYDEVKKILDNLNKNGEYSPYTMIKIVNKNY